MYLVCFCSRFYYLTPALLDDDGSGSMTTLEAFRVLLSDPAIAAGEGTNTLEFHWYSGEEGGLLGSGDIYDAYSADGEVVKAMLQQDMTGYGDKPMGVITDRVDSALTEFIRKVIDQVSKSFLLRFLYPSLPQTHDTASKCDVADDNVNHSMLKSDMSTRSAATAARTTRRRRRQAIHRRLSSRLLWRR